MYISRSYKCSHFCTGKLIHRTGKLIASAWVNNKALMLTKLVRNIQGPFMETSTLFLTTATVIVDINGAMSI
jgi:hypothetical protein